MSDAGPGDFLADPQNPALNSATMTLVGDYSRPDRLAWNMFRTLALWETDVWVPRLLDIGLGSPNPLSDREWSGASTALWATGLELDSGADVLLDGPECLVVAVASVQATPPSDEVRATREGREAKHPQPAARGHGSSLQDGGVLRKEAVCARCGSRARVDPRCSRCEKRPTRSRGRTSCASASAQRA